MPISFTTPPPKKAAPESEYDGVLEAKPGTVQVKSQKFESGKPKEPEKVKNMALPAGPPPVPGQHSGMMLRFSVGQTINLGEYESVKVYAGIDMPTSMPTLEKDWDWITSKVGDYLNEAVAAARS
jgi:hypothetical protein